MDFQRGDRVRPKGTPSDKGFTVTEKQEFDGVMCYTGTGHLWWSADELELDLTPEQNSLMLRYERAIHAYHEAESELDKLDVEATDKLPEWAQDRLSLVA